MTIREAIWLELTGSAAFMAFVPGGPAAVVGRDEVVDFPPLNVVAPVFYLEMLEAVPSFLNDPNYQDGQFRLWGYDDPHAGWVRLRRALLTAGRVICETDPRTGEDQSDRWVDSETGEVVYHVMPRGLGPEVGPPAGGLQMRAQYYSWQTRVTMRGEWP